MAPVFPAILIGGPAHSDRRALTYRLSHALQRHSVAHYALQVGNGGTAAWSDAAPEAVVAELRPSTGGAGTSAFAEAVSCGVAWRHLPLLVDTGGLTAHETGQIAAHCTHTILLAANQSDLALWHNLVGTYGLSVIAELCSTVDGYQHIIDDGATLRGVISGLGYDCLSDGICFNRLLDRVTRLFAYDADELYRAHLTLTEIELVIHVERTIYPLPPHSPHAWRPEELPTLLGSLPKDEPLGVYGCGPAWLYAALAAFSLPQRCVVFDIQQGWVELPQMSIGATPDLIPLHWETVLSLPAYTHLQFSIPGSYLPYHQMSGVQVPAPSEHGVVLDGELPNWLYAVLARTYTRAAWVGIYQTQLAGAVVVWSRDLNVPVGSVQSMDTRIG